MLLHILSVVLVGMVSCGKAKEPNVPDEATNPVKEVELAQVSAAVLSGITTITAEGKAKVLNNGGASVTSRGICWSDSPAPTIANHSAEATSVSGAGEFVVTLSNLKHATKYYVRAYAVNAAGIGYGEEVSFTTASVQSVRFAARPIFIVGSSRASYDAEIIGNGGGEITERGICWGTALDPTVADNKITHPEVGVGKFRCSIEGLVERTQYYLRAYAINEQGVSYGENVAFRTIAKGNVTYTFNKVEHPTEQQLAAYTRLQIAIDSAVWYANNYTSATKHVWLNYVPDVPTADANNEGWMRFGSGEGFQNIRTMLHEMNHTFGTGTTDWWRNRAISGGKYQLTHANQMLKWITDNDDAVLSGDTQHWWPYGLNQNSEVSSSWDYVYNCLIIEAMRKDGMTHSGAYTP